MIVKPSNALAIQIGAFFFSSLCTLLALHLQNIIINSQIYSLMSLFVYMCDAGAFLLFSFAIQFKKGILLFLFYKVAIFIQCSHVQNSNQKYVKLFGPIVIYFSYKLLLFLIILTQKHLVLQKNKNLFQKSENQQQFILMEDKKVKKNSQLIKQEDNIQQRVNQYLNSMRETKLQLQFFVIFNGIFLIFIIFNVTKIQFNMSYIIQIVQQKAISSSKIPFRQIQTFYKFLFQVNTGIILITFSLWFILSKYLVLKYNNLWKIMLTKMNFILLAIICVFLSISYIFTIISEIQSKSSQKVQILIGFKQIINQGRFLVLSLQSIFIVVFLVIIYCRIYLGATTFFYYGSKYIFHKGQQQSLDLFILQKISTTLNLQQKEIKKLLKQIQRSSSQNQIYMRVKLKTYNCCCLQNDIYILSIYDKFSRYCCVILFYCAMTMYILNPAWIQLFKLLISLFFLYNYKSDASSFFNSKILVWVYKQIQIFIQQRELFIILKHYHFFCMGLIIWLQQLFEVIFRNMQIQTAVMKQTQINKQFVYGLISSTSQYINIQKEELHYQINHCKSYQFTSLMLESTLIGCLIVFIMIPKSSQKQNNKQNDFGLKGNKIGQNENQSNKIRQIILLIAKIITPFVVLYQIFNLQCIKLNQLWFLFILILIVTFFTINKRMNTIKQKYVNEQ